MNSGTEAAFIMPHIQWSYTYKFPFSERVLWVWFPYSQPCSLCRPTIPQIGLQRALWDGFKELKISSAIHSELNLPNCRILCHPFCHMSESSQSEISSHPCTVCRARENTQEGRRNVRKRTKTWPDFEAGTAGHGSRLRLGDAALREGADECRGHFCMCYITWCLSFSQHLILQTRN